MSRTDLCLRFATLCLAGWLGGCVSMAPKPAPPSPVSTIPTAQERARASTCTQFANQMRNCLARCDGPSHMPRSSRCNNSCMPGSDCTSDPMCEMAERQERDRDAKNCKRNCSAMPVPAECQ